MVILSATFLSKFHIKLVIHQGGDPERHLSVKLSIMISYDPGRHLSFKLNLWKRRRLCQLYRNCA
jgi:hypothetical protein